MIFISYARADREFAERLANALESENFETWWDGEIPAGADFRSFLDEKLKAATRILVLWSESSVKSRWVAEEADEGANRQILVPVSIDHSDIPRGFRAFQSLDFSRWDGTTDDPVFVRFVETLRTPILDPKTHDGERARSHKSSGRAEGAHRARVNTSILGLGAVMIIAFSGWDFFQTDNGLIQSRMRLAVVGTMSIFALLTWFVRGAAASWIMAFGLIGVVVATLVLNASFTHPEFGLASPFTPLNVAAVLVVGGGLADMSFPVRVLALVASISAMVVGLVMFSAATPIFIGGSIMNLTVIAVGLCFLRYPRHASSRFAVEKGDSADIGRQPRSA